jgi:predicted DNA-binding transcriptional regulator AlpA
METLLPTIRAVLSEIINHIDSGECATSEEEERMFLDLCKMIAKKDERISKYEACRILGVSRTTFDRLVSEGRLPRGKKIAGWKELSWERKDLKIATR